MLSVAIAQSAIGLYELFGPSADSKVSKSRKAKKKDASRPASAKRRKKVQLDKLPKSYWPESSAELVVKTSGVSATRTQGKEGRLRGSWFDPAGPRAEEGGRLMQTTMNIMILEVYYRHLPVYRKQGTTDDFPL